MLSAQVDSVTVYSEQAGKHLFENDRIGARDLYLKAYSHTTEKMVYERCVLLVNLISLQIDLAEYGDAYATVLQAEELLEHYGDAFPEMIDEVNYQKACLLIALGEDGDALDILVNIFSNTDGRLFFPSLSRMLEICLSNEEYDTVIQIAYSALDSCTDADALSLLRIMARTYMKMGKRDAAFAHLERSDALYAGMDEDVWQEVRQKSLRGEILEGFKEYASAYEAFESAFDSLVGLIGEKHPESVSLKYGMARTALLAGNTAVAWRLYSEYLETKIDYLSSEMFGMNTWEMQSYWARCNEGLVDAALFCHNVQTAGENLSQALNAIMFAKSITADTSEGFWELVARLSDRSLVTSYHELKNLKMRYAQSLRSGGVHADEIKSLIASRETLIRRNLNDSGLLKDDLSYPDWKTVSRMMDDRTVAVEFVEFDAGTHWQYSAFVYRKGYESPRYIPLCTRDELLQHMMTTHMYVDLTVADSSYDEAFASLYDVIWKPLEICFRPGDKVCFSPAGLLHNVPLEYLEEEGLMFAEKYPDVRRMTVTKNVPYIKPIKDFDRMDVFGDIDYYQMARSRFSALDFPALPSGSEEMSNIAASFSSFSQLNMYTGIYATEADFKRMNVPVTGNGLLHMSTHGYYCTVGDAMYYPYYKNVPPYELKRFPFLRSALAMAGANRSWRGLSLPDGSEDGILTAQEISEMDLRGVSLVVLAACQTGLGDIGRDGVQGVQRAFRLSGADNMMVSLWSVDDYCTMMLMKYFYESLSSGMDAHRSLVLAVRRIKDEYGSPYYYAPYVITD